MPRSAATTQGIVVEVESEYVPERSDPARHAYFFIYHVTIRNEGDTPAQLITRHWIITNAEGRVQEVRGPGVVGYTPHLMPGQEFAYTSACPLDTPIGVMHGSFQLVRPDGQQFDAQIAPFTLAKPDVLN
jgi:ApaG protein